MQPCCTYRKLHFYDGNQNEIDDELGAGLDIPGIELDDKAENIGGEDEENDYYSLGGDDHLDMDENQGE